MLESEEVEARRDHERAALKVLAALAKLEDQRICVIASPTRKQEERELSRKRGRAYKLTADQFHSLVETCRDVMHATAVEPQEWAARCVRRVLEEGWVPPRVAPDDPSPEAEAKRFLTELAGHLVRWNPKRTEAKRIYREAYTRLVALCAPDETEEPVEVLRGWFTKNIPGLKMTPAILAAEEVARTLRPDLVDPNPARTTAATLKRHHARKRRHQERLLPRLTRAANGWVPPEDWMYVGAARGPSSTKIPKKG